MPYDLSNVKILIVEDMQPMLSLTVSLMNMFGFRHVHGAKTADDGYNMYRQYNHDLVVTDWLMEPKDGLDLIAMIRRNADSPNKYVPIILMTGYSDQHRVEIARDMGVTEFLMKPYSARDLYARIVQVVEKPRQFVEAGEFFGPDRRRRKDFDFRGYDRRDNMDINADGNDAATGNDVDLILQDLQKDMKDI